MVTLVLLLDVLELEIKRLRTPHLPRRGEFLHEGQELVVVPPVVEEFCTRGRRSITSGVNVGTALVAHLWTRQTRP